MAVSLPTSADVRKVRSQAAKTVNSQLDYVRTPVLAWIGVAALRWREGSRTARYVVLARSVLFVAALLTMFSIKGFIPVRLGLLPHVGRQSHGLEFHP